MRRVPSCHRDRRSPQRRCSSSSSASSLSPQPRPTRPTSVGPREQEGGDLRDLVPLLTARAQGLHQRRQVHALPTRQSLQVPRILHHHAHRWIAEEETDPYKIPTKNNLRMALFWLTQGCQPGDSLVFHYSGHGSRQLNRNGDEADGYDETLCPLDFETQGMIVDDEINATLVRPLPRGAKLHAIVDACHSGTVLDLPFLCRMNRSGQYIWEDHRPRSGMWKGTNGGEAISFSGCDDDQTSADTSALSRITSTGAMTFCFIQAIERGHGATYGSILNSMRTTIRNTGNDMGGGAVTSVISMLLTGGSVSGGLRQEPQLTSFEPFDVYSKPFAL
ncbi:metacaspase-1 isoform X2 [Magnolia sinica]|uniref:metacaspase-1 isoform X2 n=1 Tax=Magnolia sinica TaxID=86752 RepID=UPI002659B79B|nr:metacaspase-1 isoform X2 [Magnolia sinica]